ncbi:MULTISPECIES: class I SAM-dependent methyltransferase [Caproicibacterium]|jgi:SAM-dependent methyltransferase|uniref:Methyltransferase domain-containing protein n=1 Tax=Caproicibacterium lactatifermentans TaxID=2666138 RepID=A0A859DPT3_9FIRM|nr:class I SAM-dependent methyltransferase [Caproicibacterium lactatifermentans]ARP50818.1 SAM-dependent methyltransferase [Ruminococcaceae bacterium CPB6]MDD4808262.1 class I SAM-dependent methyltransferase [Oscillospiraceae bacterium]QKN23455.1 methyltransferase domain-containing protein [Caproicibacterium lactatifermentans]QKO29868.1 methyltransferase domain-containing protein [Caproicibacterium lactatifermentans]
MNESYTKSNAAFVDRWVHDGWEWGQPISHEAFENAKAGKWSVQLTPMKMVPKSWFGNLKGKKVLGLASGGGQQMPIFTAAGAECTVLDYSSAQLQSERMVAQREHYVIQVIRADMSHPLPLPDDSFDLIFHPVSNCYIENILPLWKECFRVLKKGGILLAGFDNGINYVFNEEETDFACKLPFNPLKDKALYQTSVENDWGIQFSHTIEEEIGGQLQAGFTLTDIYEDINSEGRLHDFHVPTFYATKTVK